jgi:hypothetical protein
VSADTAAPATFDDARRIALGAVAPHWRSDLGTLMVADYGREDITHYEVIYGAREWLEDGDADFALYDAPALLVDKRTGVVTELVVIENFDRLDAMRPCGRPPRPRPIRRRQPLDVYTPPDS